MTNNRFTSIGNGLRHFTTSKMLIAAAALFAFGLIATAAIAFSNKSKAANSCDTINVVYCGTHSIQDFKQAYQSNKSGHANSSVKKDYTDLQAIYAKFGITSNSVASMSSSNTVIGTVYKDGRVVVNGKVVATKAKSAGRFTTPGSTKIDGTGAYMRYTTESFASESLQAFVRIEDGKMLYAIIIDCGNPVIGTPPPTPPTPPKPQPSYVCDILTIKKQVNRTTFEFEAKGSAKNATITGYKFDFGDGKTGAVASNQTSVTTNHQYAKAGQYIVKATLVVKVDDQTKESQTADCKVKVTVAPEECKPGVPIGSKECKELPPPPSTPPTTPPTPEQPKEIPQTGAAVALAGFAGLSSIGGATAYYLKSRRSLKDLLLRK